MREVKIIPERFYVYLAIKLSYSGSNPSIDILSFCEQWDLSEVQLATSITTFTQRLRTVAQERGIATSGMATAIGIVLICPRRENYIEGENSDER